MSLSVDGVWKAGVWATTVWANGVWREGTPTPTSTTAPSAGNWDKLRKKKKPRTIRYSDFESRDAYEKALRDLLKPERTVIIEPEPPFEEEDEDDEILLAAISKVLH